MTTPERYILVKGKAGLGNRLLVLMGSMVYAELTGRKVMIDWRDGGYAPHGRNAFSLLFSSPDPGDLSRLSAGMTVAPAVWSDYLDESVEKFFSINYPENWEMDCNETVASTTTMDLSRQNYGEGVVVRWGWMHDLHLMRRVLKLRHHQYASMSDHDILKSLFRTQFKPERELDKTISKFREEHFADKSVIGVHIRYTDRAEPYERYFPRVDQYMKRHDNGVIFLATDNCEIEKVFRKRYARVVTVEKWFPPAGTPIHRNRQPDKDALSNARAAVVELYLLGACNALVFSSTSTFGYVASLLSNARSSDIVDLARGRTIKKVAKACAKWLRRATRNFRQNEHN